MSKPKKFHGTPCWRNRLWRIWHLMKTRAYWHAPSVMKRQAYSYAHVTVCEPWVKSFAAFQWWAVFNGYRDDLTIDRIDNMKGYCPENCRWVTLAEQNRNHRPRRRKTARPS